WEATGDEQYLELISGREDDVDHVMSEYEFPDLRGRWRLLHGHLDIHDWHRTGQTDRLAKALKHYKHGFALIAREFAGLAGASTIPIEFARFGTLLRQLPSEIQTEWLTELRRAWSKKEPGSTVLLARLEELY